MIRAAANAFASGILWGSCFDVSANRMTRAIAHLAAHVHKATRG